MRLQPRIRPAADDDMAAIAGYIARDNVSAAIRFLESARKSIEFLLENPGAGPVYPFEKPNLSGIRKWAVRGFRNYLIFYRMDSKTLEVLRVLHGARDLPKLFEQELTG